MSNTSNPITNNSNYKNKKTNHVMISGGEKKFMKKILSVALSTAMAFSMFASVAFGQAGLTDVNAQYSYLKEKGIFSGFPDGQAHLDRQMTRAEFAKVITKTLGLKEINGVYSFKDKNYGAKHWAAPFVEAVSAAGIMEGKNTTKKIFDLSGPVTVQEMATVLVRALDLEVPTETNNSATAWAKGYVQAAINAGLVDAKANFQSNADRALLVGAAYAVDQELSVQVESYKVIENGNAVEFTMNTGDVATAKLAKALLPNVETEVTFPYQGKEYKYKVTYVVTAATKVQSVTANNLKQVVVTFDGDLDEETAENTKNYSFSKTIDTAELSADKKSVVLTLKGENYSDSNKLDNQKAVKIKVDGVKNSDKSKTISEEITFTPVDVTIPKVNEVKGLGTKAFQVEFSEPVDRATAISTVNYKIDGKSIAGSVEYTSPTTVVVTTELATGEHKLTVNSVRDFAGFVVTPVENEFTVAVDTEAPTVVTSKSTDLTKVEIEFNEPLKSVGKVYNGVSSKTGQVTRSGNKITVEFARENALSVSENTIVVEGATDYSGNSATREVKITPTLDTIRPEVASLTTSVKDNGEVALKVKYSESVNFATSKENYTIKDKDGKVVSGNGLDSAGHPVRDIALNSDKTEATITLSSTFKEGTYTLAVAGVQDNAYVPNTILPYSGTFEVGDTTTPELKSAWVEEGTKNTDGARDVSFYLTYSKDMAIEGSGSVLEKTKYNVKWTASSDTYEALPTDTTVDLITSDTVKITVPNTKKVVADTGSAIRVTLVADKAGNFAYKNNGYVGYVTAKPNSAVQATEANAVSNNKITVKFDAKLSSIDANDFAIKNTVTGDTYAVSYDGVNSGAYNFVLRGDKVLPADAANYAFVVTAAEPNSATEFGVKVASGLTKNLADKIAPAIVSENPLKVTGSGTTYTARVTFDEAITAVSGTNVVSAAVTGVTVSNVEYRADGKDLVVTFTTDKALTTDSVVTVELNASNADSKVVKDGKGNAAKSFSKSVVFK
ncbi:S-layer homology domain-containing protein [Paenibacillus gallinarum]|uniref:S-layer homology domain-containing protein n=1 Tax=Paenibacillus gallinarum TaxID=2762232 RepID=A0ABR8SZP1_9BACL|nr:S-layer homology domain-containing protein [Paenibacillus gallinarum]MBD7968961.1 S-layer homology domain-containing protein [Paenibacillus gallinarum]